MNPLVTELAYDQEQLNEYGADNQALTNYYTAEITRIENLLMQEGLLSSEPGGAQSANPEPVLTVTINPIYAEAGEIDVHTSELGGSGTFIAPNSASVTITNNSAAALDLLGIDIPATNGGLWYDVGLVTTNAEINTINNNNRNSDGNHPADTPANPQFNLSDVAGGPASVPPSISVINTFNPGTYNAQHPDAPVQWPSITVASTAQGGIGITNPNGSLLLENDAPSVGNITLNGPVNVGTQDIITGGTVVITGVSDEEIAGQPYAAWNAITQGGYVGGEANAKAGGVAQPSQAAIDTLLSTPPTSGITGASITINADFIDVNGTITSGTSTYDLTINSGVSAEIQGLLAHGYTGMLYLANESNNNFTVDYDTQTGQIVVSSIPVSGGFVSLTGHIVDTGNGAINVFGGYGTVDVTNNTNYDLAIQTIDASEPGEGQLIINDLGKDESSASTFSVYQYVPGTGIVTESDPGGAADAGIKNPASAMVYFTAGSGSASPTITRTDGLSWITEGFAMGQSIQVSGSAQNSTGHDAVYTITGISASKLTLSSSDTIQTEGSAGAPEKVSVSFFTSTTPGNSTVYTPAAGWRYGWTIDDSEQTTYQDRVVQTNWLDLIPNRQLVQRERIDRRQRHADHFANRAILLLRSVVCLGR